VCGFYEEGGEVAVKKEKRVQGVKSFLEFPIGKDVLAVSRAIGNLLNEGWKFGGIIENYIRLVREWEVEFDDEHIEEIK